MDIKNLFAASIKLLLWALCKNKIPRDVWMTMIMGIATFTSQDHQWLQIAGAQGATITDAFTEKTTIRWGDFLKGWTSANGGHLMQDKYTTQYFDPKTLSGKFFQTKLRKGLWIVYDTMWKVRFTVLHDPNNISSLSNIKLNKCIIPYILQMPKVQSWCLQSTSPPWRPAGHSPKINILYCKIAWLRVVDELEAFTTTTIPT